MKKELSGNAVEVATVVTLGKELIRIVCAYEPYSGKT